MKEEKEQELPDNKLEAVLNILEEKLSREFGITVEELRKKVITIKNRKVTIK